MPQVQVALRAMAQGKTVRANDVMSYITTGDSQSSEHAAKRAYTPRDVLKPGSGLKPGACVFIVTFLPSSPPIYAGLVPLFARGQHALADTERSSG